MIGAYLSSGRMKRSCRQCAKHPKLKDSWNCQTRKEPVAVIYRGLAMEMTLYRCPMASIAENPRIGLVFKLYNLQSKNIPPLPGGALNFPNQLFQAFNLIDTCMDELKEA